MLLTALLINFTCDPTSAHICLSHLHPTYTVHDDLWLDNELTTFHEETIIYCRKAWELTERRCGRKKMSDIILSSKNIHTKQTLYCLLHKKINTFIQPFILLLAISKIELASTTFRIYSTTLSTTLSTTFSIYSTTGNFSIALSTTTLRTTRQ